MIIQKKKSNKKTKISVAKKTTQKKNGHIKEELTYNNYLSNVVIFTDESKQKDLKTKDLEIKKIIMLKSFGGSDFNNNMRAEILNVLPDNPKKDWVECINKCYNITHGFIDSELKSTAYFLRILTMSGIGDSQSYKFAFQIANTDIGKISGLWENDYKYFKLIIINPRTSLPISNSAGNGKLIMGYGPSASGKTFSALKVINLMRIIDPSYPAWFLSIDGGIYREQSLVYQTIINLIQKKGQYSGLSNLVSASVFSGNKSIFKSNIIKSNVKKYLLFLKTTHGFNVNLYVPETAGGCVKFINCQKTYRDYVNITGDNNWVGLLIYQHKTRAECPFPNEYKCSGTVESGITREVLEGKKFSSSAWSNSMRNGEYLINKAPIFRFKIHNSGSPNRITLLHDLSPHPQIDINKNSTLAKFLKLNNWEYVLEHD